MISNLLIVIGHRHGCMGALAEKFVAKAMININRKYVIIEPGLNGVGVRFHRNVPNLTEKELHDLLTVIDSKLSDMIGPQLSKKVIENIEHDIVTLLTTADEETS